MFKKAVKYGSKARVVLYGHSGSGKTLSALLLASTLAAGESKRVAVIDTENGSASKYADLVDFDVLELGPPYTPQRYIEALHEAEEAGYGTIVVDSLSHEWFGLGGVLEQVDSLVAASKKQDVRDAWRIATPQHNRLLYAITACQAHLLCTMRAKSEVVLEKDQQGRTISRTLSLVAIQRDHIEYEFDVVGRLDEGTLTVTKTRCPALELASFYHPGQEFAQAMLDWLAGEPAPDAKRRSLVSQILSLRDKVGEPPPQEAIWTAAEEQLLRERDRLKAKLPAA